MKMIEVANLTRKFGGFTAVDSLTFTLDRGEIFGLLGPNGAGKTTTVRMLCCLISKTSGSARIGDLDTSDSDDAMKIRKMIGLVPDNVGLYETLSAYANLEFYGRMYEFPEKQLKENIQKYLKMLDLWDKKDSPVGSFSKGMKQKVSLARALVHDPEVLFMDEPTANLDPEAAKTIRDVILDLRKENRTILLNTHNLDEAQRICNRIGVLKTRLIAVDTPENLAKLVSGRKTVILLEEMNNKVLGVVRALNPRSVETEGNKIIVGMADPDRETPAIITAIVSAGGKVRSVSETGASLEDIYLHLVRE
ncbi:MAG: ABC transporter ATP-binding protein [Candidatus Thermoplasmatota archaeon]|nr:ABC transporter ATP-binding protein [Candidatus Thermoplasmatota archaeon]